MMGDRVQRFTKLVGCDLPIQLAGMGGVGTTELAEAVAGAGGLGMVPSSAQPTTARCGVNFLMPFDPTVDDIASAADQCGIVEFFYSTPHADVVSGVHARGAIAGWQVGSASEAEAAEAVGCDYIVAQGIEAGGHVRGTQHLDGLLAEVLTGVSIPVVAAGGIATAERAAALIGAGASAVRVGTRFVASPESGAHPDYVRALISSTGDDTLITEWFNSGWPNAPHRVLRSCQSAAERSGWKETDPPDRDVERSPLDMAMYAGMGVGDVIRSEPAADIVADLVRLL
jgi:nitronate monooxygenase